MRIAAFAYDFCHSKTTQGLLHLKASGFSDVLVLAAPFKKLSIKPSKIRVTPIVKEVLHPKDVAQALGYEYVQIDHDDTEILKYTHSCRLGVVLGARILRRFLTESLPIINAHPGMLPYNRNLDNLKWAVLHNLPQTVTTHIIDSNVDRGFKIQSKHIEVFWDDNLLDIFLRLRAQEMSMIIEAIPKVINKEHEHERLGLGQYNSVMDDETDQRMLKYFPQYKKEYKDILRHWGL